MEWTGKIVEFPHSYNDFDYFSDHGCCLKLRLSLSLAAHVRHIFDTVCAAWFDGQYIPIFDTSPRWLAYNLWILHAVLLPFFLFLQKINVSHIEKHLRWWNLQSTIKRFQGRLCGLIFVLWMCFSILESSSFVQMVRCSNGILTSIHWWHTTLKTFTCTQSSSAIGRCAWHYRSGLVMGIHYYANSETIGYTSKRRYPQLREMK